MERRRRIDMRDAISKLRKLVPAVTDKKHAATVLILNEASAYCQQLHVVGEHMSRVNEEQYIRQRELSARLRQLCVQNSKICGGVDKSPRKNHMGSRSCHSSVGFSLQKPAFDPR
jgi:hypothetical protein